MGSIKLGPKAHSRHIDGSTQNGLCYCDCLSNKFNSNSNYSNTVLKMDYCNITPPNYRIEKYTHTNQFRRKKYQEILCKYTKSMFDNFLFYHFQVSLFIVCYKVKSRKKLKRLKKERRKKKRRNAENMDILNRNFYRVVFKFFYSMEII